MSKRILSWVGLLALLAWTGGGAFAWWRAKSHWTVVVREGEPDAQARELELALQRERLDSLAGDLRALAALLERNLPLLDEESERRAGELRASFAQEIAPLRARLERSQASDEALLARLTALERGLEGALALGLGTRSGEQEGAAALLAASAAPTEPLAADPIEIAPPEPVAKEPAARASFLAFRLPSDDYRFDERRSWTIVPALSRVGFDAESTLHDFSGTSSQVSGGIEVELAHPERAPAAEVRVSAGSLVTGEEGRDEGLRENLDVEHHGELRFELESFEPERIDAAAGRVDGRAHGRMLIRGVEREVELPVVLRLDDAHRLSIDGELQLSLPDYGVPVPKKLGVIRMKDEVRVWIALRARLDARGEG